MAEELGELRVIRTSPTGMQKDSAHGELRLTWRTGDADEIARAEKTFQTYLQKGWLAIGEGPGPKKQIFTFNPDLEKIVLAPLMMGG